MSSNMRHSISILVGLIATATTSLEVMCATEAIQNIQDIDMKEQQAPDAPQAVVGLANNLPVPDVVKNANGNGISRPADSAVATDQSALGSNSMGSTAAPVGPGALL